MRKICSLVALVAIAATTLVRASTVAQLRADTSLDGLLTKASAYLTEYRNQLTYVMATERSKQTVVGGFAAGGFMEETLASDVYFVYIPADNVWMAVRDVEIVDGKTVKDRDNVRELLSSGQAGAARALKDRNARYNLGSILRNFNEPTLSLLVLDDAHRQRFSFSKIAGRGARTTINFIEKGGPTLIIDTGGRPALSGGELVVDNATGRIERARLSVTLNGGIEASLTTTYRRDGKLNMWVPSKFEEQYTLSGRRPEKITSVSTYSDFSRFDVSVRIK